MYRLIVDRIEDFDGVRDLDQIDCMADLYIHLCVTLDDLIAKIADTVGVSTLHNAGYTDVLGYVSNEVYTIIGDLRKYNSHPEIRDEFIINHAYDIYDIMSLVEYLEFTDEDEHVLFMSRLTPPITHVIQILISRLTLDELSSFHVADYELVANRIVLYLDIAS